MEHRASVLLVLQQHADLLPPFRVGFAKFESITEVDGELRVTLGSETATLALKPGVKKQDATLDRFGLFTSQVGGQMVKIFLDDVSYTAAQP